LPIEGATDSQLLVRAVEPSATTGAAIRYRIPEFGSNPESGELKDNSGEK
jgi:hypothetical protein